MGARKRAVVVGSGGLGGWGGGVRQLFVGRPRGSTAAPYLLTTVATEPWRGGKPPHRILIRAKINNDSTQNPAG